MGRRRGRAGLGNCGRAEFAPQGVSPRRAPSRPRVGIAGALRACGAAGGAEPWGLRLGSSRSRRPPVVLRRRGLASGALTGARRAGRRRLPWLRRPAGPGPALAAPPSGVAPGGRGADDGPTRGTWRTPIRSPGEWARRTRSPGPRPLPVPTRPSQAHSITAALSGPRPWDAPVGRITWPAWTSSGSLGPFHGDPVAQPVRRTGPKARGREAPLSLRWKFLGPRLAPVVGLRVSGRFELLLL